MKRNYVYELNDKDAKMKMWIVSDVMRVMKAEYPEAALEMTEWRKAFVTTSSTNYSRTAYYTEVSVPEDLEETWKLTLNYSMTKNLF